MELLPSPGPAPVPSTGKVYGREATRWFGALRSRVKCLPPSREMWEVMAQFSHSGRLHRVAGVVFLAVFAFLSVYSDTWSTGWGG